MNLILKAEIKNTHWKLVQSLFDAVGWRSRSEDDIREAFGASSFVRFAYVDDELVGFGRVVSDFRYYSWIVDLVVHPNFQRHGIGSMLLKELTNAAQSIRNISLVAVADVVPFYQKHGWIPQKDATMRLYKRS